MSHHGTTRKIATKLAQNLGVENTTLVDLRTDALPDLSAFETIIIGGSIHIGRIQKRINEFCMAKKDVLLNKRVGLFLCFLEPHELKDEFALAYPEWLRNHAIAHGFFGGELLFDKMNFFEKVYVRIIYGIKKSVYEIDDKAIEAFEEKIRN